MPAASLFDRMYALGEWLTISLTPQDGPGPIMKWVFRFPLLLSKLGLGWLMGPWVLILTTRGRKTGKPRRTPVEYQYDRHHNRYYLMAGWAGNTDWYRNLRREPRVSVQAGRRRFDAIAEPVPDGETATRMLALTKERPFLATMWNRWSDRPVNGSLESYIYAARFFPSVWLTPLPGQSLPAHR